MNKWKKCLAAVLSLAIMGSATACGGTDTSWAVKSDSLTVPVGAYIYNLSSAYQQADSMKEDSSKPVLEQNIEDKDATTWIKDTALRQTKAILVINDKMSELGISLTQEELDSINSQTASYWGQISTAMTEYGVAQSSFNLAYADYYTKYGKVFDATYGKGGSEEVSDADLKDFYVKNYTAFSYVLAPVIDMTDGTSLSEEDVAKLDTEFKDYASKINSGSMTMQEAADAYKASSADDTVQLYTDTANFSSESVSYPEEFGTTLKSMKAGESRVVEVQGMYKVLLEKDDITAKAEETLANDTGRTNILRDLKSDEFQDKINAEADAYSATINQKALDSYKPTMFVPKESSSVAPSEEVSSVAGEESSSEAA